jgi:hypothetical protein
MRQFFMVRGLSRFVLAVALAVSLTNVNLNVTIGNSNNIINHVGESG